MVSLLRLLTLAALSIPWASLHAQAPQVAPLFRSTLPQLQESPIPVLLPSKVDFSEDSVLSASVDGNGYRISVNIPDESGNPQWFVAMFAGTKGSMPDIGNIQPVRLNSGAWAMFRPISCGGSCAPVNLWWEQFGATYQIQMKLGSDTPEEEQLRVVLDAANASVLATGAR